MARTSNKALKALLSYKAPRLALVVAEPGVKVSMAINTPCDAERFLEPLKYSPEEKFLAVMLNARHEVTGVIEISHGTISSSLVHPREVFKAAVLANAHAMVVAHNHPGGSRTASPDDLETTKQLNAAAKIMGVSILDHLIITRDNEAYSIRENYRHLWD